MFVVPDRQKRLSRRLGRSCFYCGEKKHCNGGVCFSSCDREVDTFGGIHRGYIKTTLLLT